jgi:hypothetical protein
MTLCRPTRRCWRTTSTVPSFTSWSASKGIAELDAVRIAHAVEGSRFPSSCPRKWGANIQSAIRYLNVTANGRQWIANLYSNVFRAERDLALEDRRNDVAQIAPEKN